MNPQEVQTDTHVLGRRIPDSLYKYRQLDIRSLTALAQNRLYFLDYKRFNDPFDFQAGKALDSIVEVSRKQGLKNEFAGLENFRICCFSSVPDDLLMWGHYADCHRGFCLEFTPANDDQFRNRCFPVEYQEHYPDLLTSYSEFQCQNEHPFTKLFTTKSKHWEYEHEWRMVSHVSDRQKSTLVLEHYYKPEVLTGIIFGMRMSKDHRMLISKLTVDLPHLKKYEVIKDKSSYALKVNEIEDPNPLRDSHLVGDSSP